MEQNRSEQGGMRVLGTYLDGNSKVVLVLDYLFVIRSEGLYCAPKQGIHLHLTIHSVHVMLIRIAGSYLCDPFRASVVRFSFLEPFPDVCAEEQNTRVSTQTTGVGTFHEKKYIK